MKCRENYRPPSIELKLLLDNGKLQECNPIHRGEITNHRDSNISKEAGELLRY